MHFSIVSEKWYQWLYSNQFESRASIFFYNKEVKFSWIEELWWSFYYNRMDNKLNLDISHLHNLHVGQRKYQSITNPILKILIQSLIISCIFFFKKTELLRFYPIRIWYIECVRSNNFKRHNAVSLTSSVDRKCPTWSSFRDRTLTTCVITNV